MRKLKLENKSQGSSNRTIAIPDDLWEQAESAASKLSEQHGLRVSVSDLIRRGLQGQVDAIVQENGR